MDQESFDRFARLLGRVGTRRTVLGVVLGTGALGGSAAAKPARQRRKKKLAAQAAADPLAGLRDCPNPGPGQNLSKCNFAGQDLRGKQLNGSNLSRASFAFANLCAANLRGANLSKTDFTGAVLTRVDFRGTSLRTADLEDAVLCQTRLPNGTLERRGCPPDQQDVCCSDAECDEGKVCDRGVCGGRPPGGGTCVAMGNICTFPFGADCCQYARPPGPGLDVAACGPTPAPLVTSCQVYCKTDADCVNKIGHPDVVCDASNLNCFVPFQKCCARRHTEHPQTCRSGVACRSGSIEGGDFECCLPGESCDQFLGCV